MKYLEKFPKATADHSLYGHVIPSATQLHIRHFVRRVISRFIKEVLIPKVLMVSCALFLATYWLTFTLSIGQKAVAPRYVDPFALYNKISPGQAVAALDTYPCGPFYLDPVYISRNLPFMNCQIRPDSGPIRLLTVVCSDGVIQQLKFDVEGLEFADVIQRWGPPDVLQETKQFYIARWDEGVFVKGGLAKAFSYHAPVEWVVLA